MNLESKRLQFVAQWLTPAFAFIVAVITISNSLGLERTLYLGLIVALVGWIVANQLVQRAAPRKSPTTEFEREHTYGCSWCSEPKVLLPPDSSYVLLQVEPCEFDDARQILWTCSNCRKINVRYWDIDHSEVREYRRKAP